MIRILFIALAVFLTSSVLLPSAAAQQRDNYGDDAIVQRLDDILKRLGEIETRLAKLEAEVRDANLWWADERGVMHDSNGRPIGFWGVDFVPRAPVRIIR